MACLDLETQEFDYEVMERATKNMLLAIRSRRIMIEKFVPEPAFDAGREAALEIASQASSSQLQCLEDALMATADIKPMDEVSREFWRGYSCAISGRLF